MIKTADVKRSNTSLKKNIDKVEEFVNSDEINQYPVHERGQLIQQLDAMKALSRILSVRSGDSDS